MANRSYLYSIDFDRAEGKRKDEEKIFGLSEYSYSIPLSFKILVSQSPKISHSIIWEYEHPIAIQGNFERGKKRLVDFLNNLSNENIFEKSELQKQIAETIDFLSKHKLENIFLECGEIYEMGNDELKEQNKTFLEEDILKIEQKIEEYTNDFRKMKSNISKMKSEITELSKPKNFLTKLFSPDNSTKIRELEGKVKNEEQEMWNSLGINYWSDILYWHFENK